MRRTRSIEVNTRGRYYYHEENEKMGWTVDNVMSYFGEHLESREIAWDAMCAVERYHRGEGTWSRVGKTLKGRMIELRSYIQYVLKPSSWKPNEVIGHLGYRRNGGRK